MTVLHTTLLVNVRASRAVREQEIPSFNDWLAETGRKEEYDNRKAEYDNFTGEFYGIKRDKTKRPSERGRTQTLAASSSEGLNLSGRVRLSPVSLTQTNSDANLQKNTDTSRIKIKNFVNSGYKLKNINTKTPDQIVRGLSSKIGLQKSESTNSYYKQYKIDDDNVTSIRLSAHPASGITKKNLQDEAFVTNLAQRPASTGEITKIVNKIISTKSNSQSAENKTNTNTDNPPPSTALRRSWTRKIHPFPLPKPNARRCRESPRSSTPPSILWRMWASL